MPSLGKLERLAIQRKSLTFHWVVGHVLSETVWSETHVSSSGGGGVLYQGSGTVQAPTVSAQAVTQREIWIKEPDGQETAVRIANVNLPVREGHAFSAVWATLPNKSSGPYVLLVNHTTREFVKLEAAAESLVPAGNLVGCLGMLVLGFGFIVFLVEGPRVIAACLALGILVLMFSSWRRARAASARLSRHLSAIDDYVWTHLKSALAPGDRSDVAASR